MINNNKSRDDHEQMIITSHSGYNNMRTIYGKCFINWIHIEASDPK